MSYLLERAAEVRMNELLAEAQRERQARVFAGQRFGVRNHVGRFMVRLGERLSAEPRQAQRLAGVAGESR